MVNYSDDDCEILKKKKKKGTYTVFRSIFLNFRTCVKRSQTVNATGETYDEYYFDVGKGI